MRDDVAREIRATLKIVLAVVVPTILIIGVGDPLVGGGVFHALRESVMGGV